MMKGYTLIELVMVIVLVGILAGIGVPALVETIDAWSFASPFQNFAVQQAIVVTNRMSREIRCLKNDASVIFANATIFNFTDINDTNIIYNRSSNVLMRNSDGLADNVNSLTFTYYNDTNGIISAPQVSPNNTDIRRIQVDFSILAGSNTLNFRSQIRPQNLRRLNEKFK